MIAYRKEKDMARDIREGDLIQHATGRRDRYMAGAMCKRMRCHLVARAERLAEVWPTDAAFRQFAAEVADAVQAAIGRGVKITARKGLDGECRCPLGCLPKATSSHPSFTMFHSNKQAFVQGFDGFDLLDWHDAKVEGPYHRLGQAYRRRFVTGAGSRS